MTHAPRHMAHRSKRVSLTHDMTVRRAVTAGMTVAIPSVGAVVAAAPSMAGTSASSSSASLASSSSATPVTHPTVMYGSRGTDVRAVQSIVGVSADGVFGPMTLAAVKAYQKSHGLVADGIVGPLTWANLTGSAPSPTPSVASTATNPTVSTATTPAPAVASAPSSVTPAQPAAPQTIWAGSTSAVVKVLQSKLGLSITGAFTTDLQAAVKSYQSAHGLVVDGVVGPLTWGKLGVSAADAANLVSTLTSAPAAATAPVTKPVATTPVVTAPVAKPITTTATSPAPVTKSTSAAPAPTTPAKPVATTPVVTAPAAKPVVTTPVSKPASVTPVATPVVKPAPVVPAAPVAKPAVVTPAPKPATVTPAATQNVTTASVVTPAVKPATSTPVALPTNDATAAQIIAFAENYLGVPYVYGGNGPSSFDCSGFTSFVFSHFGYTVPRIASAQQAYFQPTTNPQPGDLVFYGYPAYHVAIYLGNGMMLEANHPGGSVGIRPIYGTPAGYARVINH